MSYYDSFMSNVKYRLTEKGIGDLCGDKEFWQSVQVPQSVFPFFYSNTQCIHTYTQMFVCVRTHTCVWELGNKDLSTGQDDSPLTSRWSPVLFDV